LIQLLLMLLLHHHFKSLLSQVFCVNNSIDLLKYLIFLFLKLIMDAQLLKHFHLNLFY